MFRLVAICLTICLAEMSIVQSRPRKLALSEAPDPSWANPSFAPYSLYYLVGKLRPGFFKKADYHEAFAKKKVNSLVLYEEVIAETATVNIELPYRLLAKDQSQTCCQIRLTITYAEQKPKDDNEKKTFVPNKDYKSFFQAWVAGPKFSYKEKYWTMNVDSASVFSLPNIGECPAISAKSKTAWGTGVEVAKNNVWDEANIAKVAATNPCIDALLDGKPVLPDPIPAKPDCPADAGTLFHLVVIILQVLVSRGVISLRWEVSKDIKVTIIATQEILNHVIIEFSILVYKTKDKGKTETCTFKFYKHKDGNQLSKIVITGPEDPCSFILLPPWNKPDTWPFTPIEFDAGHDIYMIQIILDLLIANKIAVDIDLDFENYSYAALYISIVEKMIHYQFVVNVKADTVCYFKVVRELKNQILQKVEVKDVNKKGECEKFLVKPPPTYPFTYPIVVPGGPTGPTKPELQACSAVYWLIPNFNKNQLSYLIQTGYIRKEVWTANKKDIASLDCKTIMDSKYIMYHLTVIHPDKPAVKCVIIFTKDNENSIIHSVAIDKTVADCATGILVTPAPTGDKGPLCPIVDPDGEKKPDTPIKPDVPKDDGKKPIMCQDYKPDAIKGLAATSSFQKSELEKAMREMVTLQSIGMGRFKEGDAEACGDKCCGFKNWGEFWDNVFMPFCIYMRTQANAVMEDGVGDMIFHKDFVQSCVKKDHSFILELAIPPAKATCKHQFTIYGTKPLNPDMKVMTSSTGCSTMYQGSLESSKTTKYLVSK